MAEIESSPLAGIDTLPVLLRAGVSQYWQRLQETEGVGESLIKTIEQRGDLPAVWAGSEFVANSCLQDITLLEGLIAHQHLDSLMDPTAFRHLADIAFANLESEADLERSLRRFRKYHMVRLAWRDLAGLADLDEIMSGVSQLADMSVQTALAWHKAALIQRFGDPMDAEGNRVDMVVLGLGKLGGSELNYSSDIDLILAFEAGGETSVKTSAQKSISNAEFFIKLGRKLVQALDPITADGFVFRTDLRLRPNGDSGPIALSFAAMEHYYQTHGRSWERYALIKARLIAGDAIAGKSLLDSLRPFVYRRYLDFGAFDALREMKRMIETQVEKKGLQQDLKLGWGGIREIEFFVQSYQLIRGGRDASLRTESLYAALLALQRLGLISDSRHQTLLSAYVFLRNSEHRLQMVRDRQTQALPETDIDQQRLAFSMGIDDWSAYQAQLDHHRNKVQEIFSGIMQSTSNNDDETSPDLKLLSDVWLGSLNEAESIVILEQANISSAEQTARLLSEFRHGRLYQAFANVERDRLDRLMPLALQGAGSHQQSARAVSAFVTLIEAIGRRSVYLSLLIENPAALKQVLHLCAASPWLSRYMGQHPVILDELLQPPMDIRRQDEAQLNQELLHRIAQIDADDEERTMNVIREFMHGQVLSIAAADINQQADSGDVMQAMSRLARVILQFSFDQAVARVTAKLGERPVDAGVIAYGKFGSDELGYHSDLDIVLCYLTPDDPSKTTHCDYFFSRVGQRLVHLLTTRTHAGILYELDMRLRPSGRSGTMVTSLDAFLDYQLHQAWTWEHQALVRAQAINGSQRFIEKFEQVRSEVLCQPRDEAKLRQDVVDMRRRMVDANSASTEHLFDLKLDYGGLVDIEFILQFLVLHHAAAFPKIMIPRETTGLIEVLMRHQILQTDDAEQLQNIYQIYLQKTLQLKLMDQPVLIDQQELLAQRQQVKLLWAQIIG